MLHPVPCPPGYGICPGRGSHRLRRLPATVALRQQEFYIAVCLLNAGEAGPPFNGIVFFKGV